LDLSSLDPPTDQPGRFAVGSDLAARCGLVSLEVQHFFPEYDAETGHPSDYLTHYEVALRFADYDAESSWEDYLRDMRQLRDMLGTEFSPPGFGGISVRVLWPPGFQELTPNVQDPRFYTQEPEDYYYGIDTRPNQTVVYLVHRDYWNEYRALSDWHLEPLLGNFGFMHEVQESVFEVDVDPLRVGVDPDVSIYALLQPHLEGLGFEYDPGFQQFMEGIVRDPDYDDVRDPDDDLPVPTRPESPAVGPKTAWDRISSEDED
jgi:hypothetical protein